MASHRPTNVARELQVRDGLLITSEACRIEKSVGVGFLCLIQIAILNGIGFTVPHSLTVRSG
jgi:hypothetical protein